MCNEVLQLSLTKKLIPMQKLLFMLVLLSSGIAFNSCTKEEPDKPNVTATPSSQTIKSGETTSIVLTSNFEGTTFSWTVNQAGVTGATEGNGSVIAQTLTLTGSTLGVATYTVTPVSGGVTGNKITIVVTVESGQKITYISDIKPIMINNCGSCHLSGGSHPKKFDNYTTTKSNINEILKRVQQSKGSDGFMPQGGSKLSTTDIELLKKWQADGLAEN